MSPQDNEQARGQALWFAAMPAIFVLFWSTGFIGGKFGLPYAAPFTFLLIRYLIVAAILTAVALVMRAPWPHRRDLARIAIAGVLVHAGYLGMTFAAISVGVEAGVSSLMAGLQPIFTAVLAAPFLGERTSRRQWAGLAMGLAGTALVVSNKLSLGLGTPIGMFFALMSAVFMTTGTLFQKRYGGVMDLRTGSVVQFLASALVSLPIAAWEGFRVEWTLQFTLSMAWLCLVLSVGTISILFVLIRRGKAAEVASLFFLVPPTTAVMAYFLFDEKLGPLSLVGMVMVAAAVAIVTWKPKAAQA